MNRVMDDGCVRKVGGWRTGSYSSDIVSNSWLVQLSWFGAAMPSRT
jgi:hypothetical protein